MADNINHPRHYNSLEAFCRCGRRIECIDVIEQLPHNRGAAIKYLWRTGLKCDAIEDLGKAGWYSKREIERLLRQRRRSQRRPGSKRKRMR